MFKKLAKFSQTVSYKIDFTAFSLHRDHSTSKSWGYGEGDLNIIISLNLYSIGVRFDRNRPCNLFFIRCISGAKWTQIRHETDQKTEIRTNRSFTNVIFSRKENNKTKFSGRLCFRVNENIFYRLMQIKTLKNRKRRYLLRKFRWRFNQNFKLLLIHEIHLKIWKDNDLIIARYRVMYWMFEYKLIY